MQVTQTLNEGLKRGYSITVPASELEAKVAEKLDEARKDFQMKGFRKGKAPAALMKKMFGKSVLGEAMQEAIDDAMKRHFDATGDRPALQPEVKMTNDDWQEGQDVEVAMTYEALPVVPELDFSALTLERLTVGTDEAAVAEALDNLARTAGSFEDKPEGAAAESGDQVVIDFKGTLDGEAFEGGSAEDFPLTLGSGSFIPGFEDQLVGVTVGESRDVTVTFPAEYGAPHLAGKDAVFAVTVKSVKAPKAAEIDDELAKKFGAEMLRDGVESFKEVAKAWKDNLTEGGKELLGALADLQDAGVDALKDLAGAGGQLAEAAVGHLDGLARGGVNAAHDALKGLADLGGDVGKVAGDAFESVSGFLKEKLEFLPGI